MKKLALLFTIFLIVSCEPKKSVSFEVVSKNQSEDIAVAYTNDADSLWTNEAWLEDIEDEMKRLSMSYNTVLLFSSKDHTPNIEYVGMNYSSDYDKYMVCGYWYSPTGNEKFCYGGSDENGNWKFCE